MSQKYTSIFFEKACVLLVDDDKNSLDIAKIVLEFAGAEVVTAINGAEALTKMRTTQADLIVSDISMPILDGWELIQKIRADERLKEIPAIALTAHAMTGDREKVLDAGFDGYLSKPLDPIRLTEQIIAVLQKSPRLKAS
ncbi:MAG: response regulator [Chloroflexota bacterium]